jgi:hypothetical protein
VLSMRSGRSGMSASQRRNVSREQSGGALKLKKLPLPAGSFSREGQNMDDVSDEVADPQVRRCEEMFWIGLDAVRCVLTRGHLGNHSYEWGRREPQSDMPPQPTP